MVDIDSSIVAALISALVSACISLGIGLWVEPRNLGIEARRRRLEEQLRLVYGPLHSAILTLKSSLYLGDRPEKSTLGSPLNAWSQYPDVMNHVVQIFSNYADLIDNSAVWEGWTSKEQELRKRDFWLGKSAIEWFNVVESEYERLLAEVRA